VLAFLVDEDSFKQIIHRSIQREIIHLKNQ